MQTTIKLNKTFEEKIKDIEESLITENKNFKPFEDYSNVLKKLSDKSSNRGYYLEYKDCNNVCVITEQSLSRLLKMAEDNDFAIITAYRKYKTGEVDKKGKKVPFTKNENIKRNRKLRAIFNNNKMGVAQLVGHWLENPNNKSYEECDKSELVDVTERSYFIPKRKDMPWEEFKNLVLKSLTIDGETQDQAIISKDNSIFLLHNNGSMDEIGNNITLGKIEQAFSQHIKKTNIPFVFEGIEEPATNNGRYIFNKNHLIY